MMALNFMGGMTSRLSNRKEVKFTYPSTIDETYNLSASYLPTSKPATPNISYTYSATNHGFTMDGNGLVYNRIAYFLMNITHSHTSAVTINYEVQKNSSVITNGSGSTTAVLNYVLTIYSRHSAFRDMNNGDVIDVYVWASVADVARIVYHTFGEHPGRIGFNPAYVNASRKRYAYDFTLNHTVNMPSSIYGTPSYNHMYYLDNVVFGTASTANNINNTSYLMGSIKNHKTYIVDKYHTDISLRMVKAGYDSTYDSITNVSSSISNTIPVIPFLPRIDSISWFELDIEV